MGIYLTGMALGSITALSITNSVIMPMMYGDWRKIFWIYSSIVFLSGLLWLLISTHPESREMEANLSKLERPPQGQVFQELFNLLPLRITLLMDICIFLYNYCLSNWIHEILQTRGLRAESAGYWASIPTLIGILGALFIPRMAAEPKVLDPFWFVYNCGNVSNFTKILQ